MPTGDGHWRYRGRRFQIEHQIQGHLGRNEFEVPEEKKKASMWARVNMLDMG